MGEKFIRTAGGKILETFIKKEWSREVMKSKSG
jgi:hypothetical protein